MYVVYDIETTGLATTADDIIQFSYARFDENNIPVQAESLYFYYEGMHWSEEAYNVHHISQDFLRQYADKFEENLIKMYTVLSMANVCGYNNDHFDNVFCNNWLQRMGFAPLQLGMSKDLMNMARPLNNGHRCKLIKLCELLNITPEIIRQYENIVFHTETAAHNATYDVAATALILFHFMRKYGVTWNNNTSNNAEAEAMSTSVGMFSDIDLPSVNKKPLFYVYYNQLLVSEADGTIICENKDHTEVPIDVPTIKGAPCSKDSNNNTVIRTFLGDIVISENNIMVEFKLGASMSYRNFPFNKFLEQLGNNAKETT